MELAIPLSVFPHCFYPPLSQANAQIESFHGLSFGVSITQALACFIGLTGATVSPMFLGKVVQS
jgi:hypothetical protein